MYASLVSFIHIPVVRNTFMGVAGGIVAAARVDYVAFKSWKSFQDAKSYSWSLALWRWFQGGMAGAVAVLGPTGVVSLFS